MIFRLRHVFVLHRSLRPSSIKNTAQRIA